MKRFKLLLIFLFFPLISSGQPVSPLIEKLDESIAMRDVYFENKHDTLIVLKNMLLGVSSPKEKHNISRQLMHQYSYYENSSAVFYAELCLELAHILNDEGLVAESKLYLADFHRHTGLFCSSFDILESIEPQNLDIEVRRKYYRTAILVHNSYASQLSVSGLRDKHIELAIRNANSYLELENNDVIEYLSVMGYRLFLEKNYQQAAKTINQLLDRPDIGSYWRAEHLYYLGLIYLEMGDRYRTNAMDAFVRSAILSNELAITNLLPLLYVSVLLVERDQNLQQADGYVDIALQNARIFGSNAISEIIKTTYFPILQMHLAKAGSQKNRSNMLVVIVVSLLLISLSCLFILYGNNRTLVKGNYELRQSNGRLTDSNRMKETYIKFFLNKNLEYLEEFGRYKKHILKSLNTDTSIEKIKQEVSLTFNMDEEYNNLMLDFDRTVLELYPCFASGINDLLKPDQGYSIGQGSGNKLNTELRILALVRLGVTDNKQIASFFRITVQSVYNYRSKARSRALNEDTFDEDLANLCM